MEFDLLWKDADPDLSISFIVGDLSPWNPTHMGTGLGAKGRSSSASERERVGFKGDPRQKSGSKAYLRNTLSIFRIRQFCAQQDYSSASLTCCRDTDNELLAFFD